MNREQIMQKMLEQVAEEAVPGHTVDLVSIVRARYISASTRVIRQQLKQVAGAIALIVLILGGVLVLVPSAQAAIGDFLEQLGLGLAVPQERENATVVILEPVVSTPVLISIEQMRQQVPYDLRLPTWLPTGVQYTTGSVSRQDGGVRVTLYYYPSDISLGPTTPMLVIEVSDTTLSEFSLAESAVQSVEVNGQPAYYVHGGWITKEDVEPGGTARGLVWDSTADDAYLAWHEGDLAYRVRAHGLGLEFDEVIQIAQSLR